MFASNSRQKRIHQLKLLVLAIVIFACATSHAAASNREWCQIDTDRFSLFTDLQANDAHELASDLTLFQQATAVFISEPSELVSPLSVVAFRNLDEYADATNSENSVGFVHPSAYLHMLVFGDEKSSRYFGRPAYRVYAHYLVRSQLNFAIPRWVEDGLALYLSNIQFGKDTVAFGQLLPNREINNALRLIESNWNDLFQSSRHLIDSKVYESDGYVVSWALVHYLIHGKLDRSIPFIKQLAQLSDKTSLDEVLAPVTQVSQETLIANLAKHFRDQVEVLHETRITKIPAPLATRDCLDKYETHLLMSQALRFINPTRAISLARRMLKRGAENLEALVVLANSYVADFRAEQGIALKYAKQAYEMDPLDAGSNMAMASALFRKCSGATDPSCDEWLNAASLHLHKAMESDPRRSDALLGLGIVHLDLDEPVKALTYLRRAYTLAPWSAFTNYYLGKAYVAVGETKNALSHLQRSASWESQKHLQVRSKHLISQIR